MLIRNALKVFVTLLLLITFAGCGENSNTNGSLTLAAEAPVNAGLANFKASATITSGRTGALLDSIPITFTAVQYGTDSAGTLISDPPVSAVIKSDVSGAAVWNRNFPQKAYKTAIQVTASVDGVPPQTITVPVDALTP